jgi:AcrR family transcriptional regulator
MSLAATLRQERKQAATEEIARAALELFSRDGFDAVSVDAIAAAAGCSPRTFYRYFGTKEDVVFYDVPAAMEELGRTLDAHLADGLGPWAAVTESYAEMIGRFDENDQRLPSQRMNLWLDEPGLRARYMHYMTRAEGVLAASLHRHLGTQPEHDDLPELIATSATGAYRVTVLLHSRVRTGPKFAEHLREALAKVAAGLGDDVTAPPPKRRGRAKPSRNGSEAA